MHSIAKWETKFATKKGTMRTAHDCQSRKESRMFACTCERPFTSTAFLGAMTLKAHAPTGKQRTIHAKHISTLMPMETRVMPTMLIIPKAAGKPMIAQDFVRGPRGVMTLRNVGSNTPSEKPIMLYETNTRPTHFRLKRNTHRGIRQPQNMTNMARYTRFLGERQPRMAFCPKVMTILPYCTEVTAVVKTCPSAPVSPKLSFFFRSCCKGPISV
mmetsp:Transcript_40825/g.107903  ORF Transcript_40825/g.107903 Transcript_40825/m.107903 type:complete len:214 (+) Transcript_40825:512-1153(+)